jgi:signal transduction histidine kinase
MRRTSLILGFTALAALAILAATVTAGQLRQQSADAVSRALTAARAVNARVDGELMADDSALQVLAASFLIERGEWVQARERSAGVLRSRAGWQDVQLIDRATGRTIFSVRDGVAPPPEPGRPVVPQRLGFGDITAEGKDCPCVTIVRPVALARGVPYLMEVRVGLAKFQTILLGEIALAGFNHEGVSAIVDRKGNFIARTLDFDKRAGTPATIYVRNAVLGGSGGVYASTTYEGLNSRTAFVKSTLSGFSTHIAMPESWFGWLGAGSIGLTLAAIALALIVALVAMRLAWIEQVRWRVDQQRLVQVQKMEALGRFASGVAHDFNNMLQVILGSLPLIERGSTDAAVLRRVSMVRQAAEKGAGLTAELLQFARDKPLDLERVELAPLLGDIDGLIRRVLGDRIVLETSFAEADLAVRTNRAALEMALLNLAGNARDAMPDGGTLHIAARPAEKDDFVQLDIIDSGTGMPETVAARALDPFFTTKDLGKGTGLGLAQVHSLMLQSQGAIEIQSSPGAGTTIKLVFPTAAS